MSRSLGLTIMLIVAMLAGINFFGKKRPAMRSATEDRAASSPVESTQLQNRPPGHEGQDISLPTVKTLMEGLAWKVQRHFPLVEGVVLESVGKRLLTDLAERHGVKQSMKLIVFRPGQEFT